MNSQTEFQKNYGAPVLTETYRILLGLIMLFAGLYIAAFSDFKGHGLGFLILFGAPFVMLKDNK
jgi:hypothetical protein